MQILHISPQHREIFHFIKSYELQLFNTLFINILSRYKTAPLLGPQVLTELDRISMRLQEDGLPPAASPEERQRHLWQQLLNSEAKLLSATQELQTVRTQQANEMKEVRPFGVFGVLLH